MAHSEEKDHRQKHKVAKLAILKEDREKVTQEIVQLQGRIVQMLIPTVLSLGLIATGGIGSEAADGKNMYDSSETLLPIWNSF